MTAKPLRPPPNSPSPASSEPATWRVDLPDEAATAELARHLALSLRSGDLLALSGALGTGKTAFARALVRNLCADSGLDVPSPTFTLIQKYDGASFPVVHADFFRIRDPAELDEIGWDEASDGALAIVEWPERGDGMLASDRIGIAFHLDRSGRYATLVGHGRMEARLAQARAVLALLERSGWKSAHRAFLQGDASTRAYERLTLGERSGVLMIAPRRPDGPPIRNGRPYSAIARLAESVHAFVAMDRGLASIDLSAPDIYASDLQAGLLLIEDLGDCGVVDADGPIPERYTAATDVLTSIHAIDLPAVLPVERDIDHVVPVYDLEAMMIEVDLLIEWYAPHVGASITAAARREFERAWNEALVPVLAGRRTWTLRDFHSPNLIWRPERSGVKRVGLIDFQDAVLGHPAYDLVSLLQDARVTVPDELEVKLLSHYAMKRAANDPSFDRAGFIAAYATLGVQRNTKIAGIFARLDKRDGKPQYLKHLPRIEAYLRKGLAHPALAPLKAWYAANLPRLVAPT